MVNVSTAPVRPKNLAKMSDCAKSGWMIVERVHAAAANGEPSIKVWQRDHDCALGWQEYTDGLTRTDDGLRLWRGVRIDLVPKPF